MSSSNLQIANCLSCSVSQVVVRGKSGRMKTAMKAMTMVMMPSMMNNHLHARKPLLPSIPPVMPAVIRPEKAPLIRLPEYSIAVRKPSSFLVYHELKKNKQPGK